MDNQYFLPMNIIYQRYSIEYTIMSLANIGYKAIDLWLCDHHLLVESDGIVGLNKLSTLLEKYDMKVEVITARQSCPNLGNIAMENNELQEKTFNYWKNVIKAASQLSCKKISINAGWQLYDESLTEAINRSIIMTQRVCDYAEDFGITVLIEPLSKKSSLILNTLEDMKKYISQCSRGNLGVCIDVGTIIRNGDKVQSYFDCFKARIKHCHLTNYSSVKDKHLSWFDEDGVESLLDILSIFEKNNYQDFYSLEFTDPSYFYKPAIVYMRTWGQLLKTKS